MSSPTIRYIGFQCITNGGRQLQFSVGESRPEAVPFVVTISGKLFEGPGRISFQEAAGICRKKLQQDLDAGDLQGLSKLIALTNDDIARCRETVRPRR